MVIFHSYVSLPEGRYPDFPMVNLAWLREVPVGPWQPVTWGQPRGPVMSQGPQAAFIDASQRMPQQGGSTEHRI